MSDDGMDLELGQIVAMKLAADALAAAPRHPGHRHGLVVGSGIAPGTEVPFLVVAVQGLKGPVYVPLDDEDLAVIAAYAAVRSVPAIDLPDGESPWVATRAEGRVH